MPRKVFTAGEILTAANLNDVSDATVMVFDDASARTTAIPTPVEGMVTYLSDVNQVQAFTGSAFTAVGGVLQVVSTAKTDTFTTSSTSFTTVTGLTASITPSSTSSKILVLLNSNVTPSSAVSDAAVYFRISGGNSSTYIGDTASSRIRSIFGYRVAGAAAARFDPGSGSLMPATAVYLDSPNTTSSTTYEMQVATTSGHVASVNRSGFEADDVTYQRGASSITLMEVAG